MNPTRIVQSIGWLGFIWIILLSGTASSFIAAWQRDILIAAGVIFALMVLLDGICNRGGHAHDHDHDHDDHGHAGESWMQTAVHLLPLFLFVAVGATSLGSQPIAALRQTSLTTGPGSAAARAASAGGAAASANAVAAPAAGGAADAGATAAPAPELADGNPAPPGSLPPAATAVEPATLVNLLDLYYPERHHGVRRVEVVGRVMLPDAAQRTEMKKHMPVDDDRDLQMVLYRYCVMCCAADASPVFALLRKQQPAGLVTDDWVKVTGHWLPPVGLGDPAILELERIEKVPAPKDPYLSAPMK
jgi:hypothetical protein